MQMTESNPDPPPQPATEEVRVSVDEAVDYAIGLHKKGLVEQAARIYAQVLGAQSDNVKAMHFLGVAALQFGDAPKAELLIRAALSHEPDNADALNNLGNVLKSRGKLEEARANYERSLAIQPQNPGALTNMGALLEAGKDHDGAIALYRQALALSPDHYDAHHNLGNALMARGDSPEALDAFRAALLLRPHSRDAYRRLGRALTVGGKVEEAVAVYRKWVEIAPEDPEARHMIAAITGVEVPSRASDACVKVIFDQFAMSFDAVLERLEYKAPAIVADTLGNLVGQPEGNLDVLDAGCGTGLGGPFLRPYARSLVGVDLSDGMIKKARERGVYDEFFVSDLAGFLAERPESYDVVTAIDTFCYIGDLQATARAVQIALRPGGHSIFTVERTDASLAPKGFLLELHGRYSHTVAYLESVLQEAGLELVLSREEILRKEGGKGVSGLAIVARRPLA
jgi:predicted TPR repeat methyltransferase